MDGGACSTVRIALRTACRVRNLERLQMLMVALNLHMLWINWNHCDG